MNIDASARIGDSAHTHGDDHHGNCCPHSASGGALTGSPNVLINNRNAVRLDDRGRHTSCCGAARWFAASGARFVLMNNRPATRIGDYTRHCGGTGVVVQGSPNVMIGGPRSCNRYEIPPNWIRVVPILSGRRLSSVPYKITFDSGEVRSGKIDANGIVEERNINARGAVKLVVEV